eukprot:SAG22_NODE_7043_length_782_cov_2.371889_2_plen_124_part_00
MAEEAEQDRTGTLPPSLAETFGLKSRAPRLGSKAKGSGGKKSRHKRRAEKRAAAAATGEDAGAAGEEAAAAGGEAAAGSSSPKKKARKKAKAPTSRRARPRSASRPCRSRPGTARPENPEKSA